MVALLANQVGSEKRGGCMSPTLIRWGGLAAMLGGILWIVAAIITASKPRGCIGSEECDVIAMRDTPTSHLCYCLLCYSARWASREWLSAPGTPVASIGGGK